MVLIDKKQEIENIESLFLSKNGWIDILCTVRKAIQISAIYRNITCNVEENLILHEIFRVVSCFPRYISCYIAESRLPLGQCTLYSVLTVLNMCKWVICNA